MEEQDESTEEKSQISISSEEVEDVSDDSDYINVSIVLLN